MNRWWGNANDSDRQQSERNQRAARRYIQSNIIASDEDEFADANSSLTLDPVLNLDGDAIDMNAAEAAAELARQRALPVAESNFADDEDAWKKEIKIKFDSDINYWFNSV